MRKKVNYVLANQNLPDLQLKGKWKFKLRHNSLKWKNFAYEPCNFNTFIKKI